MKIRDLKIEKNTLSNRNRVKKSTLCASKKEFFCKYDRDRGMSPKDFLAKLSVICPDAVTLSERTPDRSDVNLNYDRKVYKAKTSDVLPPTIPDIVKKML